MPYTNQFEFQHAHAVGRILNVGCDADTSGLRANRGAYNVDIWDQNPFTNMKLPVDRIADARALPADLHGQFDTVILGDILEHFVHEQDILLAIRQAVCCLRPGGRLLLTCPEDHRGDTTGCQQMYSETVRAYHAYPVTRAIMEDWCARAGLQVDLYEHIAYPFTPQGGHGLVVSVPPESLKVDQKDAMYLGYPVVRREFLPESVDQKDATDPGCPSPEPIVEAAMQNLGIPKELHEGQ